MPFFCSFFTVFGQFIRPNKLYTIDYRSYNLKHWQLLIIARQTAAFIPTRVCVSSRLRPVLPDWARFPRPNLATLAAVRVARLGYLAQSGTPGSNAHWFEACQTPLWLFLLVNHLGRAPGLDAALRRHHHHHHHHPGAPQLFAPLMHLGLDRCPPPPTTETVARWPKPRLQSAPHPHPTGQRSVYQERSIRRAPRALDAEGYWTESETERMLSPKPFNAFFFSWWKIYCLCRLCHLTVIYFNVVGMQPYLIRWVNALFFPFRRVVWWVNAWYYNVLTLSRHVVIDDMCVSRVQVMWPSNVRAQKKHKAK